MWANGKENLFAIDRLISFGEFLGIVNIYNPERDKISVSKICTDFAIYLYNSRTMEKY